MVPNSIGIAWEKLFLFLFLLEKYGIGGCERDLSSAVSALLMASCKSAGLLIKTCVLTGSRSPQTNECRRAASVSFGN